MYCVYRNQDQGPLTFRIESIDRFYNLPPMKDFRCRFSGTMKAVKLKLGTHMDSGLMYRVYQNQGQRPVTPRVTPLHRFYNLPLMKNFRHILLKNCKGYTVETWYTHGQWAVIMCLPESEPKANNSWN